MTALPGCQSFPPNPDVTESFMKWKRITAGFSFVLLVLSLVWLSGGCGTLPDGRRWGQDVTLLPSCDRLKKAAKKALLSPGTWAPAAGALVFQIDSWDRNLAHWAADRRPIFGSRQNADEATNYLVGTLMATYGITAVAAPSGDKPKEWVWAKIKGMSVGVGAGVLTRLSTDGLKQATNRARPDGSDRQSFPSDSAALAAVYGSMTSQNLDYLDIPGWARWSLRGGLATLVLGTSWSRLEGDFHYPSDVLAGMAVGNFIGVFLSQAFIGPNDPDIWVRVQPTGKGALATLYWTF